MKSLVSIVNITGATITLFAMDFEPGVPVMVYRNKNVFTPGQDFGLLLYHVQAGEMVGYTLDGEANTAAEMSVTLDTLKNELLSYQNRGSYSPEYHWKKASCYDLIDGLTKQLDEFDFGGAGVTVSEFDTLNKIDPTLTFLNGGMLGYAKKILDGTTPDTDNDFLSAARLAQYSALFGSANQ